MQRFSPYILFFIFVSGSVCSQDKIIVGRVNDSETGLPVAHVSIKVSNLPFSTKSNKDGCFILSLPAKPIYKLICSHMAYLTTVKEIKMIKDTIIFNIALKQNPALLSNVTVLAHHKPETLVAKPNYSIYDFDFYEDQFLLLTSERSMQKAQVQLSDEAGKIISYFPIPKEAGEVKLFFRDYEGFTDLICKDSIFRIEVLNNQLVLKTITQKDFYLYLKPVCDTMHNIYYYSDQWDQYPLFNYYYLNIKDTTSHLLRNITNARLLDLYNFEYYFLPPHLQLEARRIEQYQKIDRHIAAAMMSGFTKSMFYETLYAPLFILKDTLCVFNHYTDFLYHYNKENRLLDSVPITYHHPKNWKEWKKRLYVDETEEKIYAFFSKDGHHYLKHVNYQTGRENGIYKLQYHSAEKIKIKNGFVYYIYRPFGSTQEKFLYRERIE